MTTYLLAAVPKHTTVNTAGPGNFEQKKITTMAPVEIQTSASVLPTAIVASHLLSAGFLSLLAARTIYYSYLALLPSSATRHREPLRRRHVQLFSLLATASLGTALYFGAGFAALSYRVWATERGVDLPEDFFGDKGALRLGEHPGRIHLVRWLNDIPVYRDGLEIVAEKNRHFWWGQQATLGLISFGTFLAIEGQRRKIPNLWAFMALAQLTNLSYAQNLFFVALLLTPVPLPDNVKDLTRTSVPLTSSRFSRFRERLALRKPEGWLPKPAIHIVLLVLAYSTLFLVPFASNTPSFMTVTALTRVLPFLPLALPYIIPQSLGKVHVHPHATYNTYITIFRTIAAASALLHLKSTLLALFYNTPESYYYRHSLLHPFKEEHRSALNRGYTAFGRVLGAINEHPAVGAVGWDVMLSGLSFGVWAAIRGLDPKKMLNSTVPFLGRAGPAFQEAEDTFKVEGEKVVQRIEPPSTRRRGRSRKLADAFGTAKPDNRSSKKTSTNDDEGDDSSYQPTESEQMEEGDENVEEDWEVGALAWGLISASGLGNGSAAIYGAEVMAR